MKPREPRRAYVRVGPELDALLEGWSGRSGPAQRVDVMTALKAMTLWPAYQHYEDHRKGSIEVGKLADFVVLSQDPTAIDPEKLDTLTVETTIKGGAVVYASE